MTRVQNKLSIRIDPDDLAAEMQEVEDYWNAKRGAGAMPRRADIDPLELRRYLPFLSLLEVLHDEADLDFRFRLIGTEIASRLGRDNTGRIVREVYTTADPELRQWMLEACTSVVTQKRPVLALGTLRAAAKEFVTFQILHLPLSEDGERVSILLGRARFTAPQKPA